MHMQIKQNQCSHNHYHKSTKKSTTKNKFVTFFFVNQNSVLNNDNALYDNALKHVYKKKLLFFKLTWMIILVKSRTYSV